MKTAATILAGLSAGILVAVGILAAFVFVGPDPVGLRPTPSPSPVASASVAPPSSSPVASASVAPPSTSPSPSPGPSGSPTASPSPSGSPVVSGGPQAVHIDEPAPALSVAQLGAGQVDLATFLQTTCAECAAELP